MSLLAELKRRNSPHHGGLYLIRPWVIVRSAGTVLPMFVAASGCRSIVLWRSVRAGALFSWCTELTPGSSA